MFQPEAIRWQLPVPAILPLRLLVMTHTRLTDGKSVDFLTIRCSLSPALVRDGPNKRLSNGIDGNTDGKDQTCGEQWNLHYVNVVLGHEGGHGDLG